jgi:cytochrome c553
MRSAPRTRILRAPEGARSAPPLAAFALLAGLAGSAAARTQGALPAADAEFFETRVRPVFVEHCNECHAGGPKKEKGGLRIDSREALLQGGDSGPALVPGDPAASLLHKVVTYADPDMAMPPKGKLSDAQIADIAEWIRRGAPDPRGTEAATPLTDGDPLAGSEHWAFQPLPRAVDVPTPRTPNWAVDPIDAFVLARLEDEGLAPAPQADRRTLIRRASFDLTGLPPTPEEVEAFVDDAAPDAWEKVVDRLLASPRFGERWARHWLDLSRYADSNGLDENLAMAHAWRWRDWVVDAFNRDEPYDQFLTKQLAGDLMPPVADEAEHADRLVATGFLVLGPKMLAEQDKPKLLIDVVDEQLDIATRTFMGLTVSCARCHDHKFDPVPTRDYYALAGIFKSTKTMANTDFVSRWNEVELALPERIAARDEHDKRVEAAKRAVEAATAAAQDELSRRVLGHGARHILAAAERIDAVQLFEAEGFARGSLIVDTTMWGSVDSPIVRTGKGGPQFVEYEFDAPVARRAALEVRYAAAESRPMAVLVNGAKVAEEAMKDTTGSWHLDGQRWTRVAEIDLAAGRNVVRFERDGESVPHIDAWALSEVAPAPIGDGLVPEVVQALALRLSKATATEEPLLHLVALHARLPGADYELHAARLAAELRRSPQPRLVEALLEGLPPTSLREFAGRVQTLLSTVDARWRSEKAIRPELDKFADAEFERVRQLLQGASSPLRLSGEAAARSYEPGLAATLATARDTLKSLDDAKPAPIPVGLGVADGKAEDLPVHIRGSHLNLAKQPVARGYLSVVVDDVPGPAIDSGSGRLELARWLTHPEHPLTARVMANRVWQHLFGVGLVSTPSNFGLRGDHPSHPELLDWLARDYIQGGWSTKGLVRRIMLGSTYRMSAQHDAPAMEKDPANRLLWRQNRRRLEVEPLRDAVLHLSGALDETRGGTLLGSGNGDYVTNDQSGNAANYGVKRRSLYLPVIRNAMYEMFGTFDYNDPSMHIDARPSTTDASQSLLMMNSPLLLEGGELLAKRVLASADDDEARAARLWRMVYARAPTPDELRGALAHVERVAAMRAPSLGEQAATLHGWQNLSQALLASNEFMHLD